MPPDPSTPGEGDEQALLRLADLLTPMAIRVATTLELPELVAAGRDTPAALAEATGAPPHVLAALVAVLTPVDVFRRPAPDRIGLGPLGELLRDGPLRRRFDLGSAESRMDRAWFGLLAAVTGERPGYEATFGAGFWDDLAADPALGGSFDEYLAGWADTWAPAAAEADVWPGAGEVVDVAGGSGRLLAAVLDRHPGVRGTLVEMPATAARARKALAPYGDAARVVEGSFFDPLPAGAAVYALAQVLHDWPDDEATAILRRCREALGPGGRVLVIERLAEGDGDQARMTLLMLNLFGARERDVAGYAALAGAAGLAVERRLPVGPELTGLVLAPIASGPVSC